MSTKRCLALEFESHLVRLVQVRAGPGRPRLERAEEAPSLASLLTVAPPSSTRCVAALPRHAAFSRVLQVPLTSSGELRPMVELQAKSLLPYGQADVVIDFLTLRQTATHTTLLLLGVSQPVVEEHLELLSRGGMDRPALTLATSGLLQWYRAVRPQLQLSGTVAVLEVDAHAAECLVLTDDALRFTRSISTVAAPALFEEIDRTLQSYQKEDIGAPPTQLVLTGDPSLVAQLRDGLQEALRLPVRTADAWQAVTPAPGVTLPATGAWSATVGLALSAHEPSINLLPGAVRRARARTVTHRAWLATTTLILAVLTAATGLLQVEIRRQRQLSAQLERSLADVTPRAKQLARTALRLTRVHQRLQARGEPVLLLQELYRLTPPPIVLTQWVFETTQEVRVRGIAPVLSDILGYVTALDGSPHLRDVHLRYSAERKTPSGTQVEFEIVGQVDATPPATASRPEPR